MAIQEKATTNTNSNGQPKADAWFNVNIIDANGKSHKLGGIPLMSNHPLSKAILAKAGGNPGDIIDDVKFELTASVNIVDHDPAPIEL